jgi:hypothetical protein
LEHHGEGVEAEPVEVEEAEHLLDHRRRGALSREPAVDLREEAPLEVLERPGVAAAERARKVEVGEVQPFEAGRGAGGDVSGKLFGGDLDAGPEALGFLARGP